MKLKKYSVSVCHSIVFRNKLTNTVKRFKRTEGSVRKIGNRKTCLYGTVGSSLRELRVSEGDW